MILLIWLIYLHFPGIRFVNSCFLLAIIRISSIVPQIPVIFMNIFPMLPIFFIERYFDFLQFKTKILSISLIIGLNFITIHLIFLLDFHFLPFIYCTIQ